MVCICSIRSTMLCGHMLTFFVEHIDLRRATFDCGVMAKCIQDSRARMSNTNLFSSQLDYCGTICNILEVDFRKTLILIFDSKCFRTIYNGPNATIRRDASRFFARDYSKLWTNESDMFVLLE